LPGNHKNSKIFTPNGTFYGSRAEIQCPRGYKLDGPNYITCTASGQWSAPITNCVEDESTTVKASTQTVPATTFTRPRTSSPSRKTSTSVRTSSRFSTTSSTTQRTIPISNIDLDSEEDDNESDLLPGTVREEYPGRRPVRPVTIPKNSNAPQQPATSTTTTTASAKATTSTKKLETSTKNVQEEIDAAHPEDNEVGGTNNNR
jgi:Sushi repeat (SCR repeat)